MRDNNKKCRTKGNLFYKKFHISESYLQGFRFYWRCDGSFSVKQSNDQHTVKFKSFVSQVAIKMNGVLAGRIPDTLTRKM